MRLCFMSDTHNLMPEIEPSDIVIHTGDFTDFGSKPEFLTFMDEFSELPARYKIVVSGNHDKRAINMFHMLNEKNIYFLNSELLRIGNLNFYGIAWHHSMYPTKYTNELDREKRRYRNNMYREIPSNTNVLLLHTPPYKILDRTCMAGFFDTEDRNRGCVVLPKYIAKLKQLQVVAFGHIHEAYGKHVEDGVTYLNSCIRNRHRTDTNLPQYLDI